MSVFTAISDPWVQHAIRLVRSKSYRLKSRRMIISGASIISEQRPETVLRLVAVEGGSRRLLQRPFPEMTTISRDLIRAITREANPEGVLAEVALPSIAELRRAEQLDGLRRVLVLYDVRDPGNLGTLLRSSVCFGWDAVILAGNCVDPFNFTAAQASCGAVFRANLMQGSISDAIKSIVAGGLFVFAADAHLAPRSLDIGSRELGSVVRTSSGLALILGSEAHGLRDLKESGLLGSNMWRVRIPMASGCESLNVAVAGGIFMHAMGRVKGNK
jgi:TrmH family RNA methyltransferase